MCTPAEVIYSSDICKKGLPLVCNFSSKIEDDDKRLKEAEFELKYIDYLICFLLELIHALGPYNQELKNIKGFFEYFSILRKMLIYLLKIEQKTLLFSIMFSPNLHWT